MIGNGRRRGDPSGSAPRGDRQEFIVVEGGGVPNNINIRRRYLSKKEGKKKRMNVSGFFKQSIHTTPLVKKTGKEGQPLAAQEKAKRGGAGIDHYGKARAGEETTSVCCFEEGGGIHDKYKKKKKNEWAFWRGYWKRGKRGSGNSESHRAW